jgi:hypothetical protein
MTVDRRCRHHRQRVIVLRDFNREQRCTGCGVLVFRLPPANPSDSELGTEAARRQLMLSAPRSRRLGGEALTSSSSSCPALSQGPLELVVSPPSGVA